jgi:hypothetical protein
VGKVKVPALVKAGWLFKKLFFDQHHPGASRHLFGLGGEFRRWGDYQSVHRFAVLNVRDRVVQTCEEPVQTTGTGEDIVLIVVDNSGVHEET